MLNEKKKEWFECLKSFAQLNGRKKQELIVGDNSDARIAGFLLRSRVKHNWPSQWHTRYKGGYMEFENGKKFDLENETIGGKPGFLFRVTPEIDILWRRQTAVNRIKSSMNEMPPDDRLAAAQFIVELADRRGDKQSFARSASSALSLALSVSGAGNPFLVWSIDASLALLPALSVGQLEGLAALFEMPTSDRGAAPLAAAHCVGATALVSASDPLTRPAPAGENAGGGPPSPPRGRGLVFPQAADCQLLSAYWRQPAALSLLPSDQHQVGMVNATLHVAGDGDEPPLGIEDFQ
jgi:hypothetical protein